MGRATFRYREILATTLKDIELKEEVKVEEPKEEVKVEEPKVEEKKPKAKAKGAK